MRTKKPTPPNVNELLTKLTAIELQRLDVQQQLIQLRAGKDLNFFIIPVTVLILLAGVAIGLNLGSMIWGFVAGAALALLVGYAYHLWDVQWQKAATDQVLAYINELEGEQGFLPWFSWPRRDDSCGRILFGHWSTLSQDTHLAPHPNAVCLDSGCLWGKALTALCLETNEFTSIDCPQYAKPGKV
ncbi:MAG: hypothetical protein M1572_03920 [Gammaproteobacteria bacterium]|nr:hypothetical protein [Gammaproteobacteria bacterium]